MNKRSLKTQFMFTFILIIATSAAATVLTYFIAAQLFARIDNKLVYPANHYEKQLPVIEAWITRENTALLDPQGQQRLEEHIPLQEILYRVLDREGGTVYGTMNDSWTVDRTELYKLLNTTTGQQGRYIRTVPVITEDGVIAGAVQLSYRLKTSFVKDSGNWWLTLIFAGAIISPFLYIALFTWIFSRRFTRNINQPLQLLMDASRKIQAKDLDFDIPYVADNELGRLCAAFSEMKGELGRSLSAQWRMEQERMEMVESLAHDLKAPLAIIRGYCEALMEFSEVDQAKRERYLGVIKDSADQSTKLVHQMLYTSELERSGAAPKLLPVPLHEFLSHKAGVYQLQARQQGSTLELVLTADDSLTLDTDVEKLERILDNVVSNSLEHTPAGGTVTLSVKQEENGDVVFDICDTGTGFSPKDKDKAFQKFYRGDEARGGKGGHSGLGLYIARELAGRLGGSLELLDNLAGGACVRLRLPQYL
ncbi:HAMP domain-containing sensor histidine kinase [Paenibacillus donghaensis]|uniref:histidine kinase n=1 Tax=Paenibacillus donghaensis TaxID=414771 RepID=A0A2Z2KBT8_9BACL|nr:HAMP domain-containing sensor histidine kinase [Paenibacillus donghaensis]ASA20393.1 two-component sensor histidine kinase [Paenibacillus donghaensis]